MAGRGERRGGLAGAHHPGMPEPSVDSLPVGGTIAATLPAVRLTVALLGIGLKLGLEGGKLGKRRIGVRLLVALAARRVIAPILAG